jgi:hypothetical protein
MTTKTTNTHKTSRRTLSPSAVIQAAGRDDAQAQCSPEFDGPHPEDMSLVSALSIFGDHLSGSTGADEVRAAIAAIGIDRAQTVYTHAFLGACLAAA